MRFLTRFIKSSYPWIFLAILALTSMWVVGVEQALDTPCPHNNAITC